MIRRNSTTPRDDILAYIPGSEEFGCTFGGGPPLHPYGGTHRRLRASVATLPTGTGASETSGR